MEADSPDTRASMIQVLLVDDQEMVAKAVEKLLGDQRDIRLTYCSEAVDAIRTANSVMPQVILQDLVMPRVDGLTLVRYYRGNAATSEVPLIVLSTREEPEVKARAFALGANDYLVKLPDRAELVARIRYHATAYLSRLQRDQAHVALQRSMDDLRVEQEKSDNLLLNILPRAIAQRLKDGEEQIADRFPETSVLFADIAGFTQLATLVSVDVLVGTLNEIFSRFDQLAETHGVEKIKTIGDCYMAASGLPDPREDHAEALVRMALGMLEAVNELNAYLPKQISLRIGVNSGPVVAGIIGQKKFIYDLWGDTVNIASRMESHGVEGKVQISRETRQRLPDSFQLEDRGSVEIKGKGSMETWLVMGVTG